jgi:RND family efflux transporter MFP subunit
MKKLLYLSIIAGVATLSACTSSEKNKKAEAASSSSSQELQCVSLQRQQLGSSVRLPGVLEPYETVAIYPKVSGFVKELLVDLGSRVQEGDVLMRLEAPELEEREASAKLKYTEALAVLQGSRDRYDRLLQTSKTPGTISKTDLFSAYTKVKADSAIVQGELANYKAQQTMTSYLTVTAPFSGVITERNIHPGALVGPGTQNEKPVLVLQQQNKLRLTVNVPEQYAAQLGNGSPVKFHLNALPGKEFEGRVSRSSGSLGERFRSETIEIDVPNTNLSFKAGMYAEVSLPMEGNSNAFTVPKTAVITTTERKYVVAIDKDRTHWVDVSEGNQSTDSVEIFGSLLHPGQKIITNASYEIANDKPAESFKIREVRAERGHDQSS